MQKKIPQNLYRLSLLENVGYNCAFNTVLETVTHVLRHVWLSLVKHGMSERHVVTFGSLVVDCVSPGKLVVQVTGIILC